MVILLAISECVMGKGLGALVLFNSMLLSCAGSSRSKMVEPSDPPAIIFNVPGGPRSLDEALLAVSSVVGHADLAGSSTVGPNAVIINGGDSLSATSSVTETPDIPPPPTNGKFLSPYDKVDRSTASGLQEIFAYTQVVISGWKVDNSKVPFYMPKNKGNYSAGTGLVLVDENTRARYLLTANHILTDRDDLCLTEPIKGKSNCLVLVAGKPAIIVARDYEHDLALLKLFNDNLPFYGRCLATNTGIGDFVQGFGYGLSDLSLVEGKISYFDYNDKYFKFLGNSNMGDSGGPLFVFKNGVPYLSGMVVIKLQDSDGTSSGNAGAVSVRPITDFLASYREGKRNPLAGYVPCNE